VSGGLRRDIGAWTRLTHYGVSLHLKNCTYHIAKNVCAKFASRGEHLKLLLFNLQRCGTLPQYIEVLVTISKLYGPKVPVEETRSDMSSIVEGSIIEYLRALHPRQFSAVGNMCLEAEEEKN